MDGRHKSDAQSESANDRKKDDVIDLTQVIQEGNDDEIIDLTNVLGQPGQDPDALKKGTDQTVDTDGTLIDPEKSTSDANVSEDEVLDLAEMEKTLEVDIAESSFEEDEDLVDLTDLEEPDEVVDSDMDDLGDDDDEDLLDLMETAKPDETLDSDMDELEDDDGDIIDLMETAKPDAALDSDLDELEDDDDDIIDLMETSKPDAALDSDFDDNDEIADLETSSDGAATDPLETAEIIDLNIAEPPLPSDDDDQDLSFSDENTGDEDIIDLAVMEKALEADLSKIEADDTADDEEEILDLLDAEEPGLPQAAQADDITDALPPDAPLFTDTLDPTEEIDIRTIQDSENGEDVLAPDEYADDDEIIDLAEMETALDTAASDDRFEDDQKDEDVIDLLVPETPDAKVTQDETIDEDLTLDNSIEPPTSTTVQLSEEQIEAALERTIRNIYGEKIEQLMIQTIEKTVLQEIAKIKQALMENDDDVSN